MIGKSIGASAPTSLKPASDQSTVNHLRITIKNIARQSRNVTHLFIQCGMVAFHITISGTKVPDYQVGDLLIAEYPKGNNPLNTEFSAIYPAHMKPEPVKEKKMTEIIVAGDGLSMTSLEIAVLVEKRHDNVKRTIETLINQSVIVQPQIEDRQGIDSMGRTRITQIYRFVGEQGKRDSIIVVAQLCPEFTAKLVDRWQELERLVANQAPALPNFADPVAAARAWADQVEENQTLALENQQKTEALAQAEPKLKALERISAGKTTLTITQASKVLGMKRAELTDWLAENGWVYRQNGSWVAYQRHIQNGRLKYKEAGYTDDETEMRVTRPYCHITRKGLALIAQALEIENY